jgi:hypothetical protein
MAMSAYSQEYDQLPTERVLECKAAVLVHQERFVEAIELYQQLRETGRGHTGELHGIKGLYACLLETNEARRAAAFILGEYFNGSRSIAHLDMYRTIDLYNWQGGEYSDADLIWPVFYHVYYVTNGLPRDEKRLRVLAEAFLLSHDRSLPSELISMQPSLPRTMLAYFLRHVCVQEVIDTFYSLESTAAVENERMLICGQLLELDPENKEVYSNEIAAITKTQFVREALLSVDTSKVFVDVSSLKRSIDRGFTELFARFRVLHGLDSRLRHNIVEITAVSGKRITRRETLVEVDAVVEMLYDLFLDLRDRYVFSNEFGLNSCLSIRIRHGTLVGQLRAIFERRHLVSTVDEGSGKYSPNLHWSSLNEGLGAEMRHQMEDALSKLSKRVDEIIEDVKTQHIQIRRDTAPNGLFDFSYAELEIASLYPLLSTCEDVDTFIELVLAELRRRAERCLSVVRAWFRGELTQSFLDALNHLDAALMKFDSVNVLAELKAAVAHCRTDVQNGLEAMAGWFESIGETPVPDFELRSLVDTSLEVVRRSHVTVQYAPSVEVVGRPICSGELFTCLVYAMFQILENAVIHGDRLNPVDTLHASSVGQRVTIILSNKFNADVSALQAQAIAALLQSRLAEETGRDGVQREGGSGYLKLAKICRVDLKAAEPSIAVNMRHAADGTCHLTVDDVNKRNQIHAFMEAAFPDAQISDARSFSAGRKLILEQNPDIVLLDMSMPTFDVTAKEPGGRHRAFAGREVLEDLSRRRLVSRVIIVTQFDIFGEGPAQKTLAEIRRDLELSFPDLYAGTVYYHPAFSRWQQELLAVVQACWKKAGHD